MPDRSDYGLSPPFDERLSRSCPPNWPETVVTPSPHMNYRSPENLPTSEGDEGLEGAAEAFNAKTRGFPDNCRYQQFEHTVLSRFRAVTLNDVEESPMVVDLPATGVQSPFKSISDYSDFKDPRTNKLKGLAELLEQPESSLARGRCYQLLEEDYAGGPSQSGGDIIVQRVPSFAIDVGTPGARGIRAEFDERYIS